MATAEGKISSPLAAAGRTDRAVDCLTRAPSTNVSQLLLFLCCARCSSGVESFSGLITISVEKRRNAQLVKMNGRVRWGRPRTLTFGKDDKIIDKERLPEEMGKGSLGTNSGDNSSEKEREGRDSRKSMVATPGQVFNCYCATFFLISTLQQ